MADQGRSGRLAELTIALSLATISASARWRTKWLIPSVFFSLMCPGLWSTIDETRKQRYRANGEIGFTDLLAPSLDVTAADLSVIRIPVLVIAGTTSHRALRSVAHRLAGAVPDARFVELAGCGHVTYAEQPDQFAQAVSVFAAEVDRQTTTIASGPTADTPRT